jgi:hypothetical protein
MTASRLHRWRSFRAQRMCARAGQAGARAHQHRLRRQQLEHAPVSEPEAHRSRDAATSHARSLDARGAECAPRSGGAHRAGGRATGRELSVPHSPAGQCAGRRRRAGPRSVSSRVRRDGTTRQQGSNASQGANPRHTGIGPGRRRS